jgi:hypothetical protein
MTDNGKDIWAAVSCPDAGVYLSRSGKEYWITHMDRDNNIVLDEDCKRTEGIALFLKIREAEKCEGSPEDE